MITRENYEEYMMMHADGELHPDEVCELMAFVSKRPELKKEMALYESTRLTPDTAQVFANKEALLKPVPAGRIIAFPQWKRYSIAAGIAALFFISLFEYVNTNKTNNVAAKIGAIAQPPKQITSAPAISNQVATVADTTTQATKEKIAARPVPVKKHMYNTVAKITKRKVKAIIENPIVTAPAPDKDQINSLPVVSSKKMFEQHNSAEILETKDIPAYAVENSNKEVKKTFWDKLPVDDIKKRHLEIIANAAADAYKDLSAAKQDLYDKSITVEVKVEKRKLVISF